MASTTELAAKQQAMEDIIKASFRAGFDIGSGGRRTTLEPIILWDGSKPTIIGYKQAS